MDEQTFEDGTLRWSDKPHHSQPRCWVEKNEQALHGALHLLAGSLAAPPPRVRHSTHGNARRRASTAAGGGVFIDNEDGKEARGLVVLAPRRQRWASWPPFGPVSWKRHTIRTRRSTLPSQKTSSAYLGPGRRARRRARRRRVGGHRAASGSVPRPPRRRHHAVMVSASTSVEPIASARGWAPRSMAHAARSFREPRRAP